MKKSDLEKTTLKKINSIISTRFKGMTDVDLHGNHALMRALTKNYLLKLNNEEIDYLIKNSDLEQRNNNGFNTLMLAVLYYNHKGPGPSKQQLDYLIKHSDLKQINNEGQNVLIMVLLNNRYRELNLGEEQLEYLIKNSDLNQTDKVHDDTPLTLAFKFNHSEGLNLKERMISYLIENSDLKATDEYGWNALMWGLSYYQEQKLQLSTKQWNYLINNSDLLKTDFQEVGKTTSVLGLITKHKPDLIDTVFQKAINDKNFDLDNYKNDEHYKKICGIVEAYKTKQNINNNVKNSTTNNHYKI